LLDDVHVVVAARQSEQHAELFVLLQNANI
jgi:hypothetical protein